MCAAKYMLQCVCCSVCVAVCVAVRVAVCVAVRVAVCAVSGCLPDPYELLL